MTINIATRKDYDTLENSIGLAISQIQLNSLAVGKDEIVIVLENGSRLIFSSDSKNIIEIAAEHDTH